MLTLVSVFGIVGARFLRWSVVFLKVAQSLFEKSLQILKKFKLLSLSKAVLHKLKVPASSRN